MQNSIFGSKHLQTSLVGIVTNPERIFAIDGSLESPHNALHKAWKSRDFTTLAQLEPGLLPSWSHKYPVCITNELTTPQ